MDGGVLYLKLKTYIYGCCGVWGGGGLWVKKVVRCGGEVANFGQRLNNDHGPIRTIDTRAQPTTNNESNSITYLNFNINVG